MTIKGLEKVKRAFKKLPDNVNEELRDIIYDESLLLSTHLRDDILTGGTTKNKLATQTGKLKNSVRALKPRMYAKSIRGGVVFGTNYANAHVGPKGSKKEIRPKNSKWLTIPLDAMKTKAGASRGSAQGAWVKGHYDDTFFERSKAGELILWGMKELKTKDKFTPLFVLKKSVKIPARIHPEELLDWVETRILKRVDNLNVNTN